MSKYRDAMDQSVLTYVGAILRTARGELDMPIDYADTACNLSKSSVSKIERGLVNTRLCTFLDLCEAYGVSAPQLILEAMNVREATREGEAGTPENYRPLPESTIQWRRTCYQSPDEDVAVLIAVDGEDDTREGFLNGGRWYWSAGADPDTEIDGYVYAWAEMPWAPSKDNGHLAEWHEQRWHALRRGPVALIAENAVSREEAA